MAPESHQNYQVGEMVLPLIARNELAVGISGAGLSGPMYRIGGLRGEAGKKSMVGWIGAVRASRRAPAAPERSSA